MDQENISQLAEVSGWSALGWGVGQGDKMKNKIRLEECRCKLSSRDVLRYELLIEMGNDRR
jgi:hypothetical protein